MNDIKRNPNLNSLVIDTNSLIDYEKSVEAARSGGSVSYNAETNMYDYSPNLGTDTIVSLYSTDDVLKYHFGDNLDSVLKSGDIYIISQSSKYDIIVYKGQLLGYGATSKVAEETFKEEGLSLIKDLTLEYVGDYIEENKGFGTNLAFELTETGIIIYSTVNNTDNKSNYDVSEFPKLFIEFTNFSSWETGSAYASVLEDFIDIFLSKTAESYLVHIQNELYNGSCTFDPEWLNKSLTGYDEYFEDHGTGGLQYDGPKMNISFDESAFKEIIENQIEYAIDNALPAQNDAEAFAGILSSDEVLDFYENTNAIDNFDKKLKKIFKAITDNVNKARKTVYDPLILDLNGDGFNIETKELGANFDLDKNGFAEKINWTSKDGFLCLDLNGNGTIDDGGELFGDKTLLANGTAAKNGFEALARYDCNGDGIIDENDEIFGSLRVWVDADGNGASGEGELWVSSDLFDTVDKVNLKGSEHIIIYNYMPSFQEALTK